MLPYHARSITSSPSEEGDGGGGSVSFIGNSSEWKKIRARVIRFGGFGSSRAEGGEFWSFPFCLLGKQEKQ